MSERTLIILPALNEAGNIARVVRHIKSIMPSADVLVVDDGSQDNTAQEARSAQALVLRIPYNVGIGAAVQTAFKFAARYQYDVVVRNDGDGQHAAEDIPRLIHRLQQGDVDVVIGSRFIGHDDSAQNGDYGTPLTRRIGITIIAQILRLMTGYSITDPTSGFAAFNQRAIRLFAHVYPHDYPEPEAIVVLRRSGLHLCELPVQMHSRQEGRSSITPLRSVYYMIKVILAITINMLRQAPLADN